MRQAALNDMGILIQPGYVLNDHLNAGRLIEVLSDWEVPRLVMNIAFLSGNHLPARTRLFIDSVGQLFYQEQIRSGLVKARRIKPLTGRWRTFA